MIRPGLPRTPTHWALLPEIAIYGGLVLATKWRLIILPAGHRKTPNNERWSSVSPCSCPLRDTLTASTSGGHPRPRRDATGLPSSVAPVSWKQEGGLACPPHGSVRARVCTWVWGRPRSSSVTSFVAQCQKLSWMAAPSSSKMGPITRVGARPRARISRHGTTKLPPAIWPSLWAEQPYTSARIPAQ